MSSTAQAPSGSEAAGPLEGVRVVDLTVNLLGPLATQVLGDMGADVIKVESPEGDPQRANGVARHKGMGAFFLNVNRNKRSVVLDLKRPQEREALLRLCETADVMVHSMRLPAIERLGLGYAAVAERNPRIIYAGATGFNKSGELRDKPAYDDMIQGASGLTALNERATGEARYAPMALADKLCGHLLASAVSMALFRRERTGKGQEVHLPMFETMISFNLMDHMWGAIFAGQTDLGFPRTLSRQRRPFPTLDGHICLLANTDEQARRLFIAVGREEFARDERFATLVGRNVHVDEFYGMLAEEFGRRTTAECEALLDAADIPNSRARDPADLLKDEYLRQTGFFGEVEHPSEGTLVSMGIPVTFSESPGSIRRQAPQLGEHTGDLLHELGYEDSSLRDFAFRKG